MQLDLLWHNEEPRLSAAAAQRPPEGRKPVTVDCRDGKCTLLKLSCSGWCTTHCGAPSSGSSKHMERGDRNEKKGDHGRVLETEGEEVPEMRMRKRMLCVKGEMKDLLRAGSLALLDAF